MKTDAARTSEAGPPMTDERDSVAAAEEPPRAAFVSGVFLRFQRSLLRYLGGLLGRQDAEDVAQETYLRLMGAAGLEASEIRVRAFMFKVATNLAYDRFRERRGRRRHDDAPLVALPDEGPPVERMVAFEQGLATVERTLLGLPRRCRQVFLLRVSHDWDYEAIAQHLGVSKRTVEREMQQALDACTQNLKIGELP